MSAGEFVLPTAATVTNAMAVLAPTVKIAIVAALADSRQVVFLAVVAKAPGYREDRVVSRRSRESGW